MACFFPKSCGFIDDFIKPKWFVTEVAGLLLTFIFILYNLFNTPPKDWEHFISIKNELCKAAVCVSFMEALYVSCIFFYKGSIIGTFDNSVGLTLSLCTLLPFHFYLFKLYWYSKLKRLFLILSVICSIAVIILTQSRTGYICLFLYFSCFIIRVFPRWRKILILMLSFISIAFIYLIFKIKTASSLGRWFILARSWDLIKENLVCGHGYNTFIQKYMLKQAEYFRENLDSQYAWFADEIKHPLNEFILTWVEFGILGTLLHIGIFIFLFIRLKKRKDTFSFTFFLSIVSIFIFSLFSYPMTYPLSWVILILCFYVAFNKELKSVYNRIHFRKIFLVFCLIGILIRSIYLICSFKIENKWYYTYQNSLRGHSKEMMQSYDLLYKRLKHNYYFLYNFASEQFYAERYDSALIIANECMTKWPSYNLSLLMGDICRHSEKYKESIGYYEQAFYMCPVRFAPLEGLYYSYKKCGMKMKSDSIAKIIKQKKIKIYSKEIERIKQNILEDLSQSN